jgi:hypothetical protein
MGTKLPNALLRFLKILFKAAVAAAVNKVCTATGSTSMLMVSYALECFFFNTSL